MKRRPKGMGSVTYLGAGRRKPFLATINKQSIGTYSNKEKAEKALLRHVMDTVYTYPDFIQTDDLKNQYTDMIYKLQNDNILPTSVYDFHNMDFVNSAIKSNLIIDDSPFIPSFEEIWNSIFEDECKTREYQWRGSMSAAFKKFDKIHSVPISNITANMVQECFDDIMNDGIGTSSLNNMMIVLSMIYNESEKNKYTTKNDNPHDYIKYHSTSKRTYTRRPFDVEEIGVLLSDDSAESRLILLYILTGMRPSELISIPREHINLGERYMTGGLKTDAGKQRIIPLHRKAVELIKYFFDKYNTKYLYDDITGKSIYQKYSRAYKEVMDRLELDHTFPYDTRYTFATIAKTSGMDSSVRKKIMGHKCKDITDDIYTHEPLEFLLQEIDKIKI